MIITENEQSLINFIVDRIDSLRVEQCYSIYELSQKANVSENTIKGIYRRKSFPNIYTLARICNALEITISDFFLVGSNEKAYSKKELEILTIFSRLAPRAKDAVIEMLRLIN